VSKGGFDRDGDEAGMPLVGGGITGGAGSGPRGAGSREASRIDWDHPDSWDAERAMRAILDLCAVGRTEVPIYSIPDNAVVGRAGLIGCAGPVEPAVPSGSVGCAGSFGRTVAVVVMECSRLGRVVAARAKAQRAAGDKMTPPAPEGTAVDGLRACPEPGSVRPDELHNHDVSIGAGVGGGNGTSAVGPNRGAEPGRTCGIGAGRGGAAHSIGTRHRRIRAITRKHPGTQRW